MNLQKKTPYGSDNSGEKNKADHQYVLITKIYLY